MSGMKAELDAADDVNKIFDLLSCNCATFFNYEIFEILVDHYGINDTEDRNVKTSSNKESFQENQAHG